MGGDIVPARAARQAQMHGKLSETSKVLLRQYFQ
jgi:hypothetical protein